MTLKNITLFIFIFFNLICLSQQKINEILNEISLSNGIENATMGFYAINLNTNKIIAEFNSTKLLTPASTTKLFTTAFALENLEKKYRPNTTVYYNGYIENNVLNGDIWILGNGDISLGSRYFNESKENYLTTWTNEIKKLGINIINGNIYIDGAKFGYEGAFSEWQWGDLGNYYGSHFSGIIVNDNILEYNFKTFETGKPVELLNTNPKIDSMIFINNIVSSQKNGDNSIIIGAPYSNIREGRGTLPQNKNLYVVKGSLPDPELQLGKIFFEYLIENNIKVNGKYYSTRTNKTQKPESTWKKIITHYGADINEIVKITNHESVNLFAEGLMRITASEIYNKNSHVEASVIMQNYWRNKLNSKEIILNDGSGLSRTNALSAKSLCDLLVHMNNSTFKNEFFESLPIAGLNGTLKNVGKNKILQGRIHAKSGTMRRIKSYAGYAESKSGSLIAFAFIVNNYILSNKEIVEKFEKIMSELINNE